MITQYITVDQAATERGVGTDTIYIAIKRKYLHAIKQDGKILIPRQDWEHYQANHKKRNVNPVVKKGKQGHRKTRIRQPSRLRAECLGCPNIAFNEKRAIFECSIFYNPQKVKEDQWGFCASFGKKWEGEG